ncbi:MAG TPA: EAL domain-containing protein [Clostridia bacterium]|nr:EAL domain-containing protein [Clostridia bacterium]
MFIARQPIFNKKEEVFGYELLYRINEQSTQFEGFSSQSATATVINGLFIHGLEKIINQKKAFINFDADVLNADFFHLIKPEYLVIEILEDVEITDKLINRVKEIKNEGYKIALDDFVESYSDYPLIEYADIIKFDIRETPLETIKHEVRKAKRDRKILLAEKIETRQEYNIAISMGFQLFQGYFFSKPKIVEGIKGKKSINPNYLQIIDELQSDEPSYQVISEIIERDANLTFKLLRTIDQRAEKDSIYSIKRALTYLGLKELNYWITLLLMQDMGKDKPKELLNISLIRSKFAFKISENSDLKKSKLEASLMGLLSNIDAFLDLPIHDVLKQIKVTQKIKSALLEKTGLLGDLLNLLISYEKGEWEEINRLCEKISVESDQLTEYYFESINETNNILNKINQ